MAEVTPIRTAAETALAELFPAVAARLPGSGAVLARRQEAFSAFAATGLPHRRIEAWHYTDLRSLLREAPPLADTPPAARSAAAATPSRLPGLALALVDGVAVVDAAVLAALPAGVGVRPLAAALDEAATVEAIGSTLPTGDALVQLNAALFTDGFVIDVAPGIALGEPLVLRFIRTGEVARLAVTRVVVRVGEGASLTLVESHEGPAGVAHQDNTAVEIALGDAATVEHVRVADSATGSVDLSTLGVTLGAGASVRTLALATAASLARHQVFVHFAGEGAKAFIGGGTLIRGRQHLDTTLVVDHAVPGGESRELFKHVIDGEATGVFQGKIVVQPPAQKTDGRMMSQAVLLAEGAAMNNKPELEIFADDVQCAHGATCGALDEDLLFYLRARGLPKPEAEALMLQAFVGEAIEAIENEAIRDILNASVERWLRERA